MCSCMCNICKTILYKEEEICSHMLNDHFIAVNSPETFWSSVCPSQTSTMSSKPKVTTVSVTSKADVMATNANVNYSPVSTSKAPVNQRQSAVSHTTCDNPIRSSGPKTSNSTGDGFTCCDCNEKILTITKMQRH